MGKTKEPSGLACCGTASIPSGADQRREINRVRRVQGQLEGVLRMIEGRRYCPEIIVQIQAVRAALGSLQTAVLERHLRECVRSAFESKSPSVREEKIQELLEIFQRGTGR